VRRRDPAPGLQQRHRGGDDPRPARRVDVLGLRDGFEWVMQGDIDHVIPLTIEGSARIHFRGGRTSASRARNPSKSPALLENTVQSLLRLNVSQLITIGGDDTAFFAMKLAEHASGRLRVVTCRRRSTTISICRAHRHVRFQTARHYGVEIVKNLMVDAKTTSRWYIRDRDGPHGRPLEPRHRQGRRRDADADSEEFTAPLRLQGSSTRCRRHHQALSYGRRDGVAVIGEGVVLHISEDDLAGLEGVERDEHGTSASPRSTSARS
jgi:6-phosphofructokinase 1